MPPATRSSRRSGGRSSGRSATTTSRPATAARSSSSCCATRRAGVALEIGERVRESVAALDLSGLGHAGGLGLGRGRRGRPSRHSRSTTSSTTPTRRSTGPSGRAATGWSPRSALAIAARSPVRRPTVPCRYHPTRSLDDDSAGDDDPAPTLTNGDLARIFHEIGDMLEVKGELVFKTVAYHRAADAIGRSPVDLVARLPVGHAAAHPGRRRGHQRQDRGARDDRPSRVLRAAARPRSRPGSSTLLQIPGLGPKTVRQLHLDLKIESIDDLRAAAEAGRLRDLRGTVGEDRGARPRGHRPPRHRRRTGCCSTRPRSVVEDIDRRPSPTRPASVGLEPAGLVPPQVRDRSATSTSSPRPTTPRALIGRFTALGVVDHVVNQGGYKAAVRLMRGPQVDLMVMPPGRGRAPTASTSRAPRSTTSGSARWPATRAGACPRRGSCASARTASR